MQDASEAKSYNIISRIIHWVTALIILALLVVGKYMKGMEFSEQKLEVYNLHKSFGLLVLFLVVVRIVWHIVTKKPKSMDTHAKWERVLSHAVHGFLYLLLFALPLSGWVMSSAGDFNIKFFGLNMPDIVAKDENLFEFAEEMHELFAYAVLGFVALHVAGALKHHFIDRDMTIARMTWARVGFVPVALIALLVGGVYGAVLYKDVMKKPRHVDEHQKQAVANPPVAQKAEEAEAPQDDEAVQETNNHGVTKWDVDYAESSLQFVATQYGQTFDGSFDFNAKIFFDPADLEHSSVHVEIDIASIRTGSMDRDSQAKSSDWFDVEAYPVAIFNADTFTKAEDDTYIAKGFLTLRGVKIPLEMPFELVIEPDEDSPNKNKAEMEATVDLNRLDFGVGQGQWEKTDAISDKVTIEVNLEAFSLISNP